MKIKKEHSSTFKNFIDFNVNATSGTKVGRLRWNATDRCLEYDSYVNGSTVTNQIGQETWVRVRNNTGVTIGNGKAVYVTGVLGNRPTIALSDASNHTTSHAYIGVTTEEIGHNEDGFVTVRGSVRSVDTNAFTAGDELFVSPTTPGALTNVKPTAPNHILVVGVVTVKNANTGEILVNAYKEPIAEDIPIEDAGDYFTGTEVETALQEIANGTTLDPRYLKLDGSNANTSINLQNQSVINASKLALGTSVITGETRLRTIFIDTANTSSDVEQHNIFMTPATSTSGSVTKIGKAVRNVISIGSGVNAGGLAGYSAYFQTTASVASGQTMGSSAGIAGQTISNNAGYLVNSYGLIFYASNTGSGTVDNGTGIFTRVDNYGASGLLKYARGIRIGSPAANGQIYVNYGLYVDNQTSADFGNYAIYTNLGINRLGDQLFVDGSQDIAQQIIQANSTQTKNLTEWQNSSGTALSYITPTGGALFSDKVSFTQTDGNEYIDSEADGYLTIGATSGVLINKMLYGSMYGDDISHTVTISSAGVYYAITAGLTGGESNGMTFQNNSELLVTIAGKYRVTWSMSLECGTAGQYVEGAVMVNSTAQENTVGASELPSANKKVNVAGSGIISLAVNDVVKLCVENETATNNIVVDHANIELLRIGD